MDRGAPVSSQARGDPAEQMLERLALGRGQVAEQTPQRPRSRREDGVGYMRARLGEHEGHGSAIRPGLAADEPALHEPIDEAHSGWLGPSDDASQLAHRPARPRLHMDERACLGLAKTRVVTNRCAQPIQHCEGSHSQELIKPFHYRCIPHLMLGAYLGAAADAWKLTVRLPGSVQSGRDGLAARWRI